MVQWFVIGLGGFLGALARYGLGGLAHRITGATFPVGTLAVNVLGCFLIGGLMFLVEERGLLGPTARLFLVIGFLGSFTTFSALGFETLEMMRAGDWLGATANAAANFILGLAAVALGWLAARGFWGA